MRSLTREEAATLGRRAQQPTRAPGELIAVWVPGRLVNTKNARLHHMAESRYKREWRERVALALFEAGWHRVLQSPPTQLIPGTKLVVLGGGFNGDTPLSNRAPKLVAFHASTAKAMDDDGLAVSIAPIRDALQECGVIHSDAPDSGHKFQYTQVIDRARRGVEIRISLREADARRGR